MYLNMNTKRYKQGTVKCYVYLFILQRQYILMKKSAVW